MFTPLVDINTSLSLKRLQQHIAECAKLSIGYPVNLNFDYTLLLPFLQYNLNNVGDPFVEGNFALHSKEFERQSLKWFAQLSACKMRAIYAIASVTFYLSNDYLEAAQKISIKINVGSKQKITLRHWQNRCWFTSQQLSICPNFIGFCIYFHTW